jgi:two-component system, OmpR family, alkaline phosphatase synthesis response regulator PhoP
MNTSSLKTRSKTILVVEDSPVQALSLMALLEKEGLIVLCAPNGVAGLQMARENHPDLIVLDIEMPDIDGLRVCRALRAAHETAKIPVIFLTSHANPDNVMDGLEGGAVDFIPKDDFSSSVLLQTLRALDMLQPEKDENDAQD